MFDWSLSQLIVNHNVLKPFHCKHVQSLPAALCVHVHMLALCTIEGFTSSTRLVLALAHIERYNLFVLLTLRLVQTVSCDIIVLLWKHVKHFIFNMFICVKLDCFNTFLCQQLRKGRAVFLCMPPAAWLGLKQLDSPPKSPNVSAGRVIGVQMFKVVFCLSLWNWNFIWCDRLEFNAVFFPRYSKIALYLKIEFQYFHKRRPAQNLPNIFHVKCFCKLDCWLSAASVFKLLTFLHFANPVLL